MTSTVSTPEPTCPGPDPETIDTQLHAILEHYEGKRSELLAILQEVQQALGYVPEQAMAWIARFLRIPESTVFGVVTYYSQLKLVPTGKHVIRVCRGNACHVRGSGRLLKELRKQLGIEPGQSTPDLEFALETASCLGACALAPVVVADDETHGRMTLSKLPEVMNPTE